MNLGRRLKNSQLLVPKPIHTFLPTTRAFSVLHLPTTSFEFLKDVALKNRKPYLSSLVNFETDQPNKKIVTAALDQESSTKLVEHILSVNANKLGTAAKALSHILSQTRSSVIEFSPELTSRIVAAFLAGDDMSLSEFRKILLNHSKNKPKYNFGVNDINLIIQRCFQWEEPVEALNWFIATNDGKIKVKPNQETFNTLIIGLSKEYKWDEILFLLTEVQHHEVSLSAEAVEGLLHGVALNSSGRWRHAADLIEQLAKDNKEVNPVALQRGLKSILAAKQPSVVRRIFVDHHSDWTALHSVPVLEPLGLAAIALKDHACLAKALSVCTGKFDDSAIVAGQNPDEYARMLASETLALLSEGSPVQYGTHFGVTILWLIENDKSVLAVRLWNSLVRALMSEMQTSIQEGHEADTVLTTLDHTIRVLVGAANPATIDLNRLQKNKKLSRFLGAALFNTESNAAISDADITAELVASASDDLQNSGANLFESALSVDVKLDEETAAQLLSLFVNLQDNKSAFDLLTRCFKHEVPVEERLINDLLDLLIEDRDYQLALDLAEFRIKEQDERLQKERLSISSGVFRGRKNFGGSPSKVDAAHKWHRGFSPYVYTAAMRALLATNDVETLLLLLKEVLPSKGYFQANSAYEVAIQALYSVGRYEEAVKLFTTATKERAEFVKAHKDLPVTSSKMRQNTFLKYNPTVSFARKIHFSNYSVAADSPYNNDDMVLTLLKCCAQARLGVDALQVFVERENHSVKGLAPVLDLHHRTTEMANYVLVSLANKKYIRIVPEFLSSVANMKEHFVPEALTLRLAVVAGVVAQDADTVAYVLDFAKQFNFSAEKDLDKASLVEAATGLLRAEEMQSRFALEAFVESCEHFRDVPASRD